VRTYGIPFFYTPTLQEKHALRIHASGKLSRNNYYYKRSGEWKMHLVVISNPSLDIIYIEGKTHYTMGGTGRYMRMPPPWSRQITQPATRSPGLLGFIRASGYVSEYLENDPYLQAAHLPK
jgi:hypothetical protein